MDKKPRIFIGYADEDKKQAENVHKRLATRGMGPWMASKDIQGGRPWRAEISQTIRESDFVIVCCTKRSLSKRGYLQKEVKEILEMWKLKREDDIYFIPLRLENCALPDSFNEFHAVDLFARDGWERLIQALETGMKEREKMNSDGTKKQRSQSISPPNDKETHSKSSQAENATDSSSSKQPDRTSFDLQLKKLVRDIQELFGDSVSHDSPLPDAFDNITNLVEAIKFFHRAEPTVGEEDKDLNWEKDLCMRFISGLLSDINRNANELKKFIEDKPCLLEFESTAAAITGSLLSEQMRRLEDGDHYFVVSDLASWRDDQLRRFRLRTQEAIVQGVHVWRVFNLIRSGPKWNRLSLKDKRLILQQHLQDSEDWNSKYKGKYEVRVFTWKEFEELKPSAKYLEQEIENAHFGIFRHGRDTETLVEYGVLEYNLSKMTLQRDPDIVKADLGIFFEMWEVASTLTKETINTIHQARTPAKRLLSREKTVQ